MIQKILSRLNTWHWRLRFGSHADISQFYATSIPTDAKPELSGKLGSLFRDNCDERVHKWLHYLPIYERLLSPWVGKPVRFLEIGVFQGGSLRLWRNYFGIEAHLTGIDINPDCAAYDGMSGRVRIGSQADPAFLRNVVAEMGGVDVVLDDGSHVGEHQRISFETLFPLLSEGGLYLIEDLHTAYWPGWDGGVKRPGTGIELLKDMVDSMHAHYRDASLNSSDTIPPIGSIQFFDSIAAVEKRRQLRRHHVMVPAPEHHPYR